MTFASFLSVIAGVYPADTPRSRTGDPATGIVGSLEAGTLRMRTPWRRAAAKKEGPQVNGIRDAHGSRAVDVVDNPAGRLRFVEKVLADRDGVGDSVALRCDWRHRARNVGAAGRPCEC
jgi:hypothetical protein